MRGSEEVNLVEVGLHHKAKKTVYFYVDFDKADGQFVEFCFDPDEDDPNLERFLPISLQDVMVKMAPGESRPGRALAREYLRINYFPGTRIILSAAHLRGHRRRGGEINHSILEAFFTKKEHEYGTTEQLLKLTEIELWKDDWRIDVNAAFKARCSFEAGKVRNVNASVYWRAAPPLKFNPRFPASQIDKMVGDHWLDRHGNWILRRNSVHCDGLASHYFKRTLKRKRTFTGDQEEPVVSSKKARSQ